MEFRDQLIADYSQFIKTLISIRDARIAERVRTELDEGLLWPEPLLHITAGLLKNHRIRVHLTGQANAIECRDILSQSHGKP